MLLHPFRGRPFFVEELEVPVLLVVLLLLLVEAGLQSVDRVLDVLVVCRWPD